MHAVRTGEITTASLKELLDASQKEQRQLCLYDTKLPAFFAQTPITADGNFTFWYTYALGGHTQTHPAGEGRQSHLAEDLVTAWRFVEGESGRLQQRGAILYPDPPHRYAEISDDVILEVKILSKREFRTYTVHDAITPGFAATVSQDGLIRYEVQFSKDMQIHTRDIGVYRPWTAQDEVDASAPTPRVADGRLRPDAARAVAAALILELNAAECRVFTG